MRRPLSLLLAPLLLAGLLSACGSGSDEPEEGLPTVSGDYGDKPKIKAEKGVKAGKKLQTDVLEEGDGPKVKKGDLLVADYLGQIYKSGKVFDNSYDRGSPAGFPIGIGQVIPGWDKALVGTRAGSRVLLVVPPKLGYG
ncbi:MAG: FKBP-type peptidyl-prolyl cis-trans isomerase, partial [Actinomycetes bacterium]